MRAQKIFLFFSVFLSQNRPLVRLYRYKDFFHRPKEGVPAMTHAYLITAAAVLALAMAVFSVVSILPV